MKSKFCVMLCGTVLALAGCASIGTQFTKMAEPESGSRARVRIAANMLVRGMPESACVDWRKPGAGTVFGGIVGSSGYRGRSLDMPNPNGKAGHGSGEMYVRGGAPVTYVLSNTPESIMLCDIAVTFTPQENRDYELSMQTGVQGTTRSVCTAQVMDITGGGNVPVEIAEAAVCGR